MNFNASLFREMAVAMKANGLLAVGYDLLSAGGSTYKHQGIPPFNSSNESNAQNVIVRNASGYYEIDPARFPGPGSTPQCLNATTLRACCGGAPCHTAIPLALLQSYYAYSVTDTLSVC